MCLLHALLVSSPTVGVRAYDESFRHSPSEVLHHRCYFPLHNDLHSSPQIYGGVLRHVSEVYIIFSNYLYEWR